MRVLRWTNSCFSWSKASFCGGSHIHSLSFESHKEDELCKEVEAYVHPTSDTRLEEIRLELKKDEILKVLVYHVEHGWPENGRDVYRQNGQVLE